MGEYLPYGLDREPNDLLQFTSYKFTDQEQDSGTGLYNYDARLYDPVIGQFVMADSIVPDPFNPQSFNRYAYCLNSPLIYTDPNGHSPIRVSTPQDRLETFARTISERITEAINNVVDVMGEFAENAETVANDPHTQAFGELAAKVAATIATTKSKLSLAKDLYDTAKKCSGCHLNDEKDPEKEAIENALSNDPPSGASESGDTSSDTSSGDTSSDTFDTSNEDIGGASAGDGPKIICVELYRQGLLETEIYEADEAFGRYLYVTNNAALKGYHLWAKPVVKLMRTSKAITNFVYFFAEPWTEEMAYRMGVKSEGNFFGKVLMTIGLPICEMIGNYVNIIKTAVYMISVLVCFIFVYLFINSYKKIENVHRRFTNRVESV